LIRNPLTVYSRRVFERCAFVHKVAQRLTSLWHAHNFFVPTHRITHLNNNYQLGLNGPAFDPQWWQGIFSSPYHFQTSSGAQPDFYNSYRGFYRRQSGQAVALNTLPHLAPRLIHPRGQSSLVSKLIIHPLLMPGFQCSFQKCRGTNFLYHILYMKS